MIDKTQSAGPVVKLCNPEVVKDYFYDVGSFASVCYAPDRNVSADKTVEALEKIGAACIKSGHWSPGRHQYFLFEIDGGSRTFTHQLVRHSVGIEINQRSQRYINEAVPAYYVPSTIKHNAKAMDVYAKHMEDCWSAHKALQAYGIPNEDAREVLPNATLSDINIAISLQALSHLCNERLCAHASYQIRAAVEQMRRLVIEATKEEYKSIMRIELCCKCDKLGYCPERVSCGKYKTDDMRKSVPC